MDQALDFLDELRWRGLLNQSTDADALSRHLGSGPRRAYIGFDPTADSLTIGNLVAIMLLVHFQRAGHEPLVVMGGGTGLIGDPSGKSAERQLLDEERVRANVDAQRGIFERVFSHAAQVERRTAGAPPILNNLDWLGWLGYIEVLRNYGKHFSVNMMMQKDSVRERLHARDQGISYTEFSYMILQSIDFAHLWRERGVTVQMGGSDQWGNIVAGIDLVHRFDRRENPSEGPHGLTAPLVTKSDGGKFGKSEAGAIWLTAPAPSETSPSRTSAYAFHQFWLNTADGDVERFLKMFTLFSREEIESLLAEHNENPARRAAQRALAAAVTDLVHGPDAREQAEKTAAALFSGDVAGLPAQALEEVLGAAPATTHDRSSLAGEGVPLVDLLAETSLASSKSEARRRLAEGAVTVNGRKAAPDTRLTSGDLLHGRLIALRRGKKSWHLTRWE